jgi:hypothetical protein
MRKLLAATLVLLALTAPVTSAQQPFEAVVSGFDAICGAITAPDLPVVQWFTPDRTDFGLLDPFAVASGDGLRVLGLASTVPGMRIVRLEPDGSETPFFASNLYSPRSITQASNGRVFVGAVQGPAPVLLVISSTGVLETVYSVPSEMSVLAVGPDGCTLYYANALGVGRFNGCTGVPMTPYVTTLPLPSTTVRDIYPLPDGNVLIAVNDRVELRDPSGAVIRTILLSTYGYGPDVVAGQVAASADLSALWIVATSECEADEVSDLLRIAMADGRELSRRSLMASIVTGLIIGTAGAVAVPTATDIGLLLIGMIIAGAGVLVLRAR